MLRRQIALPLLLELPRPASFPTGLQNPPGAIGVRRAQAKIASGSLLPLATLTGRVSRGGLWSRRVTGRLALIILAIIYITVGRAVTVIVGPDSARKAADRSTDDGTR